MKPEEITEHELKVFVYLKDQTRYVSSRQIAEGTGVALRTAYGHASQMYKLGIVDQAVVAPGYRYKLFPDAAKRNPEYIARLERAAEVHWQRRLFDGQAFVPPASSVAPKQWLEQAADEIAMIFDQAPLADHWKLMQLVAERLASNGKQV